MIKNLLLWAALSISGLIILIIIEVGLSTIFGSNLIFPSVLIWFIWSIISIFLVGRIFKRFENRNNKSEK